MTLNFIPDEEANKKMATLATFFKPVTGFRDRSDQPKATTAATMTDADPYVLQGLPNDNIYLFCKRIDNSRLVRQADTQAKSECWSAIGGVCAVSLLIGGATIAPSVASIMDSYKIQDLKQEQVKLRTEQRKLNLDEERMINASRLEALAPQHNLVRPEAEQVIRLQPKPERSFAMNSALKPR